MEIVEAIVRILKADSALASLATGGVWDSVAGREAKPPYVVVTQATADSAYSHEGPEFRRGLVDVKAITQDDRFAGAEAIRAQFDATLLAINGTGENGIMLLIREAEIRYPEFDKDVRYNHCGWTYRFMLDEQ